LAKVKQAQVVENEVMHPIFVLYFAFKQEGDALMVLGWSEETLFRTSYTHFCAARLSKDSITKRRVRTESTAEQNWTTSATREIKIKNKVTPVNNSSLCRLSKENNMPKQKWRKNNLLINLKS